jgi:hypothetical protein
MKVRISIFFLTVLVFSAGAASAASPARIIALSGDVKVSPSSSVQPRTARTGDALETGAWIVTGAASSCELSLGEGNKSAVKIRPGTSARIVSLDPVRMELTTGKMLALVRGLPKNSTFELATPVGVGSVRGTTLTASPEAFEAIDDSVVVKPADGGPETVLEEGQAAVFEDGGFSVKDIPLETMNETKEEARTVETHLEGAEGSLDVLSQDPGAPQTPKEDSMDALSEAQQQGAELTKEKDRKEEEKSEGSDEKNISTG